MVKKELSNYQRGRMGLTATHKASVAKVSMYGYFLQSIIIVAR